MYPLNAASQVAPAAPSITRWSQLSVTPITVASSNVPGSSPTTTRFSAAPTARMHALGVGVNRAE